MLTIKNLGICIRADQRIIIENFSYTLRPGDRTAIIGEEGNGKSTLLRAIYDGSEVETYADVSGEIGREKMKLAYLPQELSERELAMTVREFIERRGACDSDYAARNSAAGRLGLDPSLLISERLMSGFSGGEKVKLGLAAVLLASPDAMLLDEPSNDIDIPSLETLEEFILGADCPVMFVSHDETLLENCASVIIHIEQLRKKSVPRITVANMPYREYVSGRENDFENQERISKKERDEFDKKQRKLQQIYERVNHEQNSISRADPAGGRLLKKKMHTVKSMQRRFEREEQNLTALPESEDAILPDFDKAVGVPSGKTVLELELAELNAAGRKLSENISLRVMGGEHVCIVGRNGAGKTTLLRIIAGKLLSRSDIKAAYMPQDYAETYDFSLPAVELLAPSGKKDDVTRARTYLGSMKFTHDEMLHPASELSGGQKAKLLFVKLILDGANVLLLDEPTRNFSPMSNPVIRRILREFGGTIIAVSHDRKFISEVSGRIVELTAAGLSELDEI